MQIFTTNKKLFMNKLIAKLLLGVLFVLGTVCANAQSAVNYYNAGAIRTTGNAYTSISGVGTSPSATATWRNGNTNTDDNLSGVMPIGFTFYYMGTAYTSFSVSTNGYMTFNTGTAATGGGLSAYGYDNINFSATSSTVSALAPFYEDLQTAANASTQADLDASIKYQTSGIAGSRILTVEWINMQDFSSTSTSSFNFQVKLYEVDGHFEYNYATFTLANSSTITTMSYSLGINAATVSAVPTAAELLTQQTVNTATFNNAPSNTLGGATPGNMPTSGTRYTFTPQTATPASPTGITFSTITQTAITVGWTDNSTTEVSFVVTRANDAGFTTNVVNTTVPSTTSAGTGTTYSSVQSGLLPGQTYYFRIVAINEGTASAALTGSQATTVVVKTSAATGLWSAPGTWSPSGVPTSLDNVIIADGTTVTIDVITATCNNLQVGQGASGSLIYLAGTASTLSVISNVTVTANGNFNAGIGTLFTHALNIGGTATTASAGSIINNGTFDMSGTAGVITTFFGNLDGSISGAGAANDFYVIITNKGTTQTGATMDVTSVITQLAPTASAIPRLVITAGTFKMSSASVITPYFGNQIICTSIGRLWLNNAAASIQCVGTGISATGAGSPTVTGELRIDNGTFGYGQGNNTLSFSSGSGVLRMSGGTLNIFGAVSFPSSGATQLIMSGGNINVDPQNIVNLAGTVFSIGSLTTVNWSGGIITIVDPNAATAITAWTASSGGSKTITGGTLRLGDGISGTASGATPNTNGFGILSTMNLFNLEINNRTDLSNTRIARMTGQVSVINQVDIKANGYLFTGSTATGQTLLFAGSTFINNGILAGSEFAGTQSIGTVQFSGTSGTQTVSGTTGTFVNNGAISLANTGAGVNFSQTNQYNVNRANLFFGTFINSNKITIGLGAATLGVIQVGGSAGVNAGSFDVSPTLNIGTGGLTVRYDAANAVTTGVEIPVTRIIGSLVINNTNGVTLAGGNLTMNTGTTPTLTMTLGNFNIGANNITLGLSGATVALAGTLTYTAGFITATTGTFTRWYTTTGLPIVAGTSVGYYPFATGGNNRQVQLFFSTATALTVGGTITVGHNNVAGLTTIAGFLDGAIIVDRRSNSNWAISTGGGITALGTMSLAIRGDNTAVPVNVADLRLIQATGPTAVGTFGAGTGTVSNPVLNRTALSVADLTNSFYLGSTTANLGQTYTAIASANWGENGTWDLPGTPGAGDNAIIPSPYNVTVAGSITPYVCNNLTINAGGTLTNTANTLTVTGTAATGIANAGTCSLSGGTVTIGPVGGGNRTFANTGTGTLNVSGTGTLNINGNLSVATGSFFTQSGTSNINVDGNAAGVIGNSVLSGTNLVNLVGSAATISLTGGTFTIIDPHVAATLSLSGNVSTATNSSTAHTFVFGNGVSTDPGGSSGFFVNLFPGANFLVLGNVVANGGAGLNRFVNTTSSVGILGNLTINSGSEYRSGPTNTFVAGNIIVNAGGIFTNANTLNMASFAGGTAAASANAQNISGTGSFRNSVPTAAVAVGGAGYVVGDILTVVGGTFTSQAQFVVTAVTTGAVTSVASYNYANYTVAPTTPAATTGGTGAGATLTTFTNILTPPSFATFVVNNSNVAGVTLSTGTNLSIGTALTLTAGVINTNSSNVLTLTTGVTTPPSGSATSYVNGPLAIQVSSATNVSRTFAIGQSTFWRPVALAAFHSGGTLQTYTAEVINGATGGTPNAPLINLNAARYYRIQNTTNIFSTTIATAQLSYGGDDASASPAASARVAQATTATGVYTSRGGTTTASPTTGIISATAITLGDEYFVIGNESSPPITWVGGTGNWSDATMWSSNPLIPTSTDNITIAPGAASVITVDGNYAINDITIGTNATVNLGVNTLTVNRDYSQTAGTINLGTGILDLKRNFTKTAGTFTASTGLTSLTGTAGQTFSSTGGITLYNFNLSGAGGDKTFTAAQTITVSNNLSVDATTSINLSAATATTMNAGGNLIYSATAGGANIGSLTLNLTNISTGIISASGSGLITPNITIASTGLYSLGSNFEISTGRTFTVTGILNAGTNILSGAGAFTIDGTTGRLGVASSTADVNATIAVTGTKTFNSGSIIDYNAVGAQAIAAANHPAPSMLYTSGSGTKSLNANLTISGTSGSVTTKGILYVNTGTTFSDGGFRLTSTTTGFGNVVVEGSYLSSGTGSISYESGPTASKIRAVDGTVFGDLLINFGSSTSTISLQSHPAATTVNFSFRNMVFGGAAGTGVAGGTLVLNSVGTTNVTVTGNVNLSPLTATNTGGGFGGTTATTGTVRVRGNITSTSTNATQPILNATGTNTLILDGAGAQSVQTTATVATVLTGVTLRLANSNTTTIDNATLATTCTVSSATGANSLSFTGVNNPGTLTFDAANKTLGSLTINRAGATATLGNALIMTDVLTITAGTLNLNTQSLTLKSTASGTARVATILGTLTPAGATNVTMERWIKLRLGGTGRAYRLLAPTVNTTGTMRANWMEGGMNTAIGTNVNPVSLFGTQITGAGGNANFFDVTASNASSAYFTTNAVTPTYTAIGSTQVGAGIATLNALTGYFMYIRGDRAQDMTLPLAPGMPTSSTTLRTTGTILQGPQTAFTNGYVGGGALNLVTNPYPSPIDWSLVNPASSGITGSYTYWDANIGTRGGFATVTTGGISTPATSATQFIQSGQAFFVESDNIAPTPAVSIQEGHKVAGNNNDVFLVPPPPVESFRTALYFNEPNGFRRIADGAIAVYNNSYSAAVDAKDAKEINNWDENIAISRDGKHLAIEGRPVIGKSDDLPIFMNNMKKQAYEFEFTPLVFTNTNLKAELIDNYLGTRTLLSVVNTTVVSFTITDDAASKATERFKVVFGAFGSPTGVDAITIKASQLNGGVQVDWTSKTETDMVRYEVEKSTYGTTFVKANSTSAFGNSTNPVNYNWFDTNPSMGTNFYRIKGVDKAGNVRYSDMVRVLFGKGEPAIVFYPNPVEGRTFKIDMYNLVKGTYVLNLYSNDGRLVHTEQLQHDGSQATRTINLKSDISKGAYQLQLMNDGGFRTSKILIKN